MHARRKLFQFMLHFGLLKRHFEQLKHAASIPLSP